MEKNVLELLENAAERYGKKTAAADVLCSRSFEALRDDSKRMGSALVKHGIYNCTVPVFMENSVLALEAFFGIVYAGGSYSLMNPVQPDRRIEAILKMLASPVVITDHSHLGRLKDMSFDGCILLAEDLLCSEIDNDALREIYEKGIDTDPLYINFTSGSTGVPKGVVVGHRSVIDFIHGFTRIFNITECDVIGNQAPFDFDVSVKDIYSMLLTGASMYIIPRTAFLEPKSLLDILDSEKVTTLIWSVSALCMITMLKGFSFSIPGYINKVLFSGEVMPASHLNKWREAFPEAMFANLYGPTEITCNCTYHIIGRDEVVEKAVPIGRPFPNKRVFLLDGEGHEITEANAEGEICVAGSSLGLGYFNDRERTNSAFVQNPLHDRYNDPVYKTGDMAYYREDGELVYVGRRDLQIKHLGHRIELLEIDAHLNMTDGIDIACCLYDEQKKQIVAVYRGSADKAFVKQALKTRIMKYMIPEKFIRIDEMPLTPNGKTDRKKLRETYL